MQTPNTIEGAITEDIMLRAVQKLGKFPAHNYNRLFEAVIEGLNANLPAARQAPLYMDGEMFAGIQRITALEPNAEKPTEDDDYSNPGT